MRVMQNVLNFKGNGWRQLIKTSEKETICRWAYSWTLHLECGHAQDHLSESRINRWDAKPPAWVDCKQCEGKM